MITKHKFKLSVCVAALSSSIFSAAAVGATEFNANTFFPPHIHLASLVM